MAQNWLFLSIAGSFGALLVGWLDVVSRGLYLARHLFTLYHNSPGTVSTHQKWTHPPKNGIQQRGLNQNLAKLEKIVFDLMTVRADGPI